MFPDMVDMVLVEAAGIKSLYRSAQRVCVLNILNREISGDSPLDCGRNIRSRTRGD